MSALLELMIHGIPKMRPYVNAFNCRIRFLYFNKRFLDDGSLLTYDQCLKCKVANEIIYCSKLYNRIGYHIYPILCVQCHIGI